MNDCLFKWHNSYSHATNDCNVFHRQVQTAINEGRLSLKDMHVDWSPFPVNKLDFKNPTVLIRPEQAHTIKTEECGHRQPETGK
jgi:hypothetical protein